MRRSVKVAVWALVFSACAGAGAFVASRTDPFPPGVGDPGDRTSPTASVSLEPGQHTWVVRMSSQTKHVLHVGGECRTSWDGIVRVEVAGGGRAEGTGQVELRGEAECDTTLTQVQVREIRLKAVGTLSDGRLELTFKEAGRDPVGSRDLGGFVATLSELAPSMREDDPTKLTVENSDGNLGRYVSVTTFVASCAEGC